MLLRVTQTGRHGDAVRLPGQRFHVRLPPREARRFRFRRLETLPRPGKTLRRFVGLPESRFLPLGRFIGGGRRGGVMLRRFRLRRESRLRLPVFSFDARGSEDRLQPRLMVRPFLFQVAGLLHHRILQPGVHLRMKELLHDALALLRIRQQETPKFPLREEDDLPELLHSHAEEPGGALLRLLRREEPLAVGDVVERRLRLLEHEAPRAAFPRPHLLGHAGDAVPFLPDGKVEGHFRPHVRPGVVAPKALAAPVAAAGLSVESVAHRIENGGFPRPRGPADEKELLPSELLKINDLPPRVGTECRHDQFQRSHSLSASFRTVSRKARSSSVSARP